MRAMTGHVPPTGYGSVIVKLSDVEPKRAKMTTPEVSKAPVSLQELVVNEIKQSIIFGRLRPRERLIEDELITKYGASRHQIRAAFVDLEKMGVVTRRANKGAIVRDFTVGEVEQLYEMRGLLQSEAARRIPLPVSPQTLAKLEEIHRNYCAAIEKNNLQRVCTINNEFHRVVFSASNNKPLEEMIQKLWTETLAIRCYAIGDPALLARSRGEHEEILNALRTGNRRELMRLSVDHIWPAFEAYKRAHGGWSAAALHTHPQIDSQVATTG